ncbi:MAG: hypothetical protein ACTHMV_02100 [Chitinophagaceae bacterium]
MNTEHPIISSQTARIQLLQQPKALISRLICKGRIDGTGKRVGKTGKLIGGIKGYSSAY